MPPRRTFSDVNRELQSVKATADRLRWEQNETKKNLDALGKKYKNVKKALKTKTKPVPKKTIPKPPGQAGRKSTVDKNGRKRNGYCLQDAMNLGDKKAVYLDFRSLVIGYLPKDRYQTFDAIPTVVRGSICAKVLKKYAWLDNFTAHWPVDDVLRGNFNNRTSYRKDRDNGALARRRGHRESQGVDITGEDAEGGGEEGDERGWADGYGYNSAVEAEIETSDEAEEDVQLQGSRMKRRRVIASDEEGEEDEQNDKEDNNEQDMEDDEQEANEEPEQDSHITRKRKRSIDEEEDRDTRHTTYRKGYPRPTRTASPTPSCDLRPTPFRLPSISPSSASDLSAPPSPPPTIAKTAKKPTKKPTASIAKSGIRRSERKK